MSDYNEHPENGGVRDAGPLDRFGDFLEDARDGVGLPSSYYPEELLPLAAAMRTAYAGEEGVAP